MVNLTEAARRRPVLRRLRLAQLQLVRMAGDGANFRSMAQALRVTQPAITKMAHELEQTLGARVFERGSGGMRLTEPFGHSVLAHARRALAALDQLADDLPHYRDAGTPALRIGSPAFTAAALLGAAGGAVGSAHARRARADDRRREPATARRAEGRRAGLRDRQPGRRRDAPTTTTRPWPHCASSRCTTTT